MIHLSHQCFLKIVQLDLYFLAWNSWYLTSNPFLKVGHSIGAYISMEMFRRSPDKVITNYSSFRVYHATCHVLLMQKNPAPNPFPALFNRWIGYLLCWTISIFGIKLRIQEADYHWEDFSVNLFPFYKQYHFPLFLFYPICI